MRASTHFHRMTGCMCGYRYRLLGQFGDEYMLDSIFSVKLKGRSDVRMD